MNNTQQSERAGSTASNVRDKLLAKQARELAELELKEQVASALPIKPDRIFVYPLYGREGTITFGSEYGMNEKRVSLLELAELLEKLPPLPMVKAKGTFTQFLGETYYDSGAHKEKRETDVVESIFPVVLETESVSGFRLEAMWLAEVNGKTWEINAILDKPFDLAHVHARKIEYRGGFRYDSSSIRLEINSRLNPPEGYWNAIRWAAGSPEYINKFTAYHGQYDVDPVEWAKTAYSPMAETRFEAAVI